MAIKKRNDDEFISDLIAPISDIYQEANSKVLSIMVNRIKQIGTLSPTDAGRLSIMLKNRDLAEIEQLKEELEQWQSTNLELVCELTRIECENNQLKSELEQSVKLPCKCENCKYADFMSANAERFYCMEHRRYMNVGGYCSFGKVRNRMSNLNELINNGMLKYADEKGMGIEKLPFTNADKIRSMSDEELAEFIQDIWCDNHGYFVDKLLSKSANPICILEMLKREV